jgi:hypothetical protein
MTEFERFILVFSSGYFTYDLVAMWYYGLLDSSMCMLGLLCGLEVGHSVNYLIDALFVTEISNPTMHARLVLKHLGKRYTKAYEVSELSYICKFHYSIL